jgi:hypothetical protein
MKGYLLEWREKWGMKNKNWIESLIEFRKDCLLLPPQLFYLKVIAESIGKDLIYKMCLSMKTSEKFQRLCIFTDFS